MFISSTGTYGSSGIGDKKSRANPGFACSNTGTKPFWIMFDGIELVADNVRDARRDTFHAFPS